MVITKYVAPPTIPCGRKSQVTSLVRDSARFGANLKRYIVSRRGVKAPGPATDRPYTRPMVGVILLLVLGVGICAVILWGMRLPPTRPRPDSRYRGRTYESVHRRLRRNKPPE